MLAGSSTAPRTLEGWLVEPKWDGVRVMVTVHDGRVRLTSRNGNDVTAAYPELAGLAAALEGRSAVLDGEVVTFDDRGRPSFQRLQRRMHVRSPAADLVGEVPVEAILFDVLWVEGELLTGRPTTERRRVLEGLGIDTPCWRVTPLMPPAPVDELLRACQQVGLEGYMLKRADAAYLPGRRSTAWVKLKCVQRREMVVGGWLPGQGGRSGSVGSLAVGLYGLDRATGRSDGRLHFAGAVGSGLTEDWIRQLTSVFDRAARDDNPFAERLIGVRFVEPVLVAEVGYSHVTEGGTLRHPTLQGFRTDLDPAEVVADEELQAAFDARPPQVRIRLS
jgi:bifunctional non-homologous end joining protein LigD